MPTSVGVILAFVALFCWGFSGYLLQRSTRRFGDWESIFTMSLVGFFVLFPFATPKLLTLNFFSFDEMAPLVFVSVSLFIGALVLAEALRRGKLSVIESVGVVEIPVAGAASYLLLKENIVPVHWLLVGLVLAGILLVVLRSRASSRGSWMEHGSLLGIIAGILTGVGDFAVSYSAREVDPILTVWVFNFVTGFSALLYLTFMGRLRHFLRDVWNNKGLMIGAGLLDNAGWVAFAFSILFIPIVIALVLSEGYIILAVLLGVMLNKERLHAHQVLGILVAIAAAMTLAAMYA